MSESKCISLVLLYAHHLLVLLLSSYSFSLQTATLVFLSYGEVCLPAKHIQVGGDAAARHVISRWHVNILGMGYS